MSGFNVYIRKIIMKKVIFIALVIMCSCFIVIQSLYGDYELNVRSFQLREIILNMYINLGDTIRLSKYKGGAYYKRDSVIEEYDNIRMSYFNVFFIESSCIANQRLKKNDFGKKSLNLNARQVCAVESTAKTNPDRIIYILYSCPLPHNFMFHSPNFSKVLFGYENVQIVQLNLKTIFEDTPLKQLYYSYEVQLSNYPIEILSDLLRIVVLWRFGGTYLDLDIITIKSLNDLGTNYIGLESSYAINGAVINVKPIGSGHDLMHSVLEYISLNFNSWKWGANGPRALTNVILQECKLEAVNETIHDCEAIHVLPQQVFYPVHFSKKDLLFNITMGSKLVEEIKMSSYIVHFWNHISHGDVVKIGSNQVYGLLATEFCPNVVEHLGSTKF